VNGEHVQPVRSLTPDRRGSRLRTVIAVVAPLALLVVVVGGGVLGRVAGTAGTGRDEPRPSALANAPTRDPDDPLPPPIDLVDAGFPTDTLGLTVRTVEETVERIGSRRVRERVVAVAGWLSVRPPSEACPNEVDRGTGPTALCPRETVLVGSPEPVLEIGADGEIGRLRPPGAHLHPVALPGVSIGGLAGRQYRGLARALTPVPVVVIGRIGDERLPECRSGTRHCGEGFALERVVWIDGEWQDQRALQTTLPAEGADPSPETRHRTIDAGVPGAGAVLSEILVPRDALAGVDAGADAAVDPAVSGPVWYVRFLLRVGGPGGTYPRDVGWAVVEDGGGALVAADPDRTAAGPEPAFPARVLGIATVDAAAAGRLLMADVEPDRLVAVAGWLALEPENTDCLAAPSLTCRQSGLLADVPGLDDGSALFVETRLDVTIVGENRLAPRPDAWSEPVPAVVVGRFAPRIDRECGLRRPRCEPVFTVDVLAWLDGAGIAVTADGGPAGAQARSPENVVATARAAIEGSGEVLGVALVDPWLLDRLQPEAGLHARGGGPVWLVRTVAFRPRQDMWYEPIGGWAVVDDGTGAVLAAHPARADGLGWRP
jgi:hypothetical protein